jgi:CBS domain-containing protein
MLEDTLEEVEAMKAQDVMSPMVYTVRPEDPVARAVVLICQRHISGVPVVNKAGCLVGLISQRDILRAMYPEGKAGPARRPGRPRVGLRELKRLRAADIMVRQVVTSPPEADLLLLASLMATRKIRRIPIVVKRRLVGIVSQGDVYRGIFQGRRWEAAGEAARGAPAGSTKSGSPAARARQIIRRRSDN